VTFACFYLSFSPEILFRDHEIIKWCARDLLSRGHKILCRSHGLLSRGHEIIKGCARDTMLWPRVNQWWEQDN
jgi:hypothetical protein